METAVKLAEKKFGKPAQTLCENVLNCKSLRVYSTTEPEITFYILANNQFYIVPERLTVGDVMSRVGVGFNEYNLVIKITRGAAPIFYSPPPYDYDTLLANVQKALGDIDRHALAEIANMLNVPF